MSETERTLGPWECERMLDGPGYHIFHKDENGKDITIAYVSRKRNAHLITASLEMYKELENVMAYLETMALIGVKTSESASFTRHIKKVLAKARRRG